VIWLASGFDERWELNHCIPLEIVGPRILVLPIRTKRTDIARRIVDKPMPNHLIFSLKAFAALTARTARNGAIVRSGGGVNIRMRVQKVLRLEGESIAAGKTANVAANLGMRDAIDAHAIRYGRGRSGDRLIGTGSFGRAAAVFSAGSVVPAVARKVERADGGKRVGG
jgi:hypothetical protein